MQPEKKEETETFVDETETKQTVGNTFTTLSFVFLGMVVTALLFWSYQKTDTLFISLFSLMVFGYSLMMVIFISVIRDKLTVNQFKIFITASIFMSLCTLVLFVYFVIRAIQFLKRSGAMTTSYQQRAMFTPPNVPEGLHTYANQSQYRPPTPYSHPEDSNPSY